MKEDLKASEITEVAKEVVTAQQGISGQAKLQAKQANTQAPQAPGTQAEQAPSEGLSAQDQAELAEMKAKHVEQMSKSGIQRFNEEPFIVAIKALLAKIDLEPKIGWEVEWQAVRRELKALEESMQ